MPENPNTMVTYRASFWRIRVLLPLLGLGVCLWVTLAHGRATSGGILAFWVFVLVVVALLWRIGVYPRLDLDESGFTVVNPIRATHWDWQQVDSLLPSYWGLRINLHTGSSQLVVGVLVNGTWISGAERLRRTISPLIGSKDC